MGLYAAVKSLIETSWKNFDYDAVFMEEAGGRGGLLCGSLCSRELPVSLEFWKRHFPDSG